ncbi:right-handed parallel beta-helix repeat-containing protein [Microbacterium memoriense]|uniref:Right-handed parallel beta-helix repeat-containing protein n=1 Tax=Microbacterium memoriense TaxID=2978350 RepID=A0ABT2PFN2_9MICO|nr:right-handed parallel beta-helix repeat-containing protein [Microbacterium memoriense]MCT9002594.1 right-handed parallel beta-helix repeat-containing protein [Microbacterium memoriense]
MSEPREQPHTHAYDGHITDEERGDTATRHRKIARSVLVTSGIALLVAIVVTGNMLTGASAAPWASGASPSASAGFSTSATDGSAGGMTADEANEALVETARPALAVAAIDEWASALSRLSWDDPTAVTSWNTVILHERAEAYGVGDLVALGALRQDDASTYSLVRSLVVRSGARLQLDLAGVTLRLLSDDTGGFTRVVGWGGDVVLNGAAEAPLVITSWSDSLASADTTTADGRGFVWVRNGRLEASFTVFDELGFWSGRTGGVAVTATDLGLASVSLSNTTHRNLTFGMFLSDVAGGSISDATVVGAELSGIRITNGSSQIVVSGTTISNSGQDGILVDRASSDVTIETSTVSGATRDGIRIDGTALARTANAAGDSPVPGSAFTVRELSVSDSGSAGVSFISGNKILLEHADISGAHAALLLEGPIRTVTVAESTFQTTGAVAVAVTGDVTDAQLISSTIAAQTTAVKVTDAILAVSANSLTVEEGAAITVSGSSSVETASNVLRGSGPSGIEVASTAHVFGTADDTSQWTFVPVPIQWLNRHPIAWLWAVVLVIPVVGLPLIIARQRRHRELRKLLEAAIVRHGHAELARYGHDGEVSPTEAASPREFEGADTRHTRDGTAPGTHAASPRAPAPREGVYRPSRLSVPPQAGGSAAFVRASSPPVPSSSTPLRSSSTSSPAQAGVRPRSPQSHPRSLQDLRVMLSNREFASMQQFAVAAVVEAGYPISVIARLFRVPAWRIEQWVEQTVSSTPRNAHG